MRALLAVLVWLANLLAEASATGTARLLQGEDGDGEAPVYVPLQQKRDYPLDAGMMILGALVGALGVPLLFLIWAVMERRKPEGGAFKHRRASE
mmetsp:Transcript_30524/g.57143  ORF Transcript_30524/g.57143 Transcript_30524/m.57143 type:complete len:94 (-) Transcript_30524:41-322(-)